MRFQIVCQLSSRYFGNRYFILTVLKHRTYSFVLDLTFFKKYTLVIKDEQFIVRMFSY